ncbi:MAG: PQQ-binding-like beta-propeller repeat protein [Trebonia sp.]
MEPLAPTDPRVAGEFRLSARLGLGGMGRVYLGYSPAGRAVAVKVCHPDLAADPAFVQRFAREATAAQAVNGVYTAQVLGAGPYDKPPWMATVYVPGPPLSDYVHGFGPLPELAVWRLAAGLAEALLAVHATGLVHRDLKPSNVLLAVDGPRVIDFGIASALEDTALTTTGGVLGSPPYMAPEQAMGTPTGQASDVFALGGTLAFAATGAAPFGDGDAPAVLFRVVHMAPALDHLPDRLRYVLGSCLAKDPAARPTLPQLLRACQDAAAAGGNSAASFWPRQMTAVIAGYQDSLASAPPPPAAPPSGPVGPHPQTVLSAPGAPLPSPSAVSAIGRRRVLYGVGGLVVAGGLAAAGWKLTSSGGGTASARTTTAGTADKRVAWVHKAAAPVRTGAALSANGETLYIGSDDGTVYRLDAATGRQVSTFPADGAVSGVAVAGPTLLVGSADRKVHAFLIDNGGLTWTSAAAGAAIAGAPTWGGNVVYAGSEDGYLYALDLNSGQRIWRTLTGGTPLPSQPTGTGVVWAGSQDGTMYVLDAGTGTAGTGKVVDKVAVGGPVGSAPLTVSGQAYAGTSKGVLYKLFYEDFTSSIEVNLKFRADGAITGTPVPATSGDIVFAATTGGTVYAVQPGSALANQSGMQLWSLPVGGPVRSGLALDNDTVYAGSDDEHLYAIDLSTGKVRWTYKAGGAIRGSVLAANGLIYFGCLDHRVYALRTDSQ